MTSFEKTRYPSPFPTVLIWSKIVEQIRIIDNNFDQIVDRYKVKRFPDGTLNVEGDENNVIFYELLETYKGRLINSGKKFYFCNHTRPRGLTAFTRIPSQGYNLLLTRDYFENIGGEQELQLNPSIDTPTKIRPKMPGDEQLIGLSFLYQMAPPPGEKQADHLQVRVRFWGGLEQSARPKFYQAIVAWADSVGIEGIFGEGPAFLYLESFLFDRRWASFQINVSESGQNTVNWLTLSILNFANLGNYVSEIRYGDAEEVNVQGVKRGCS